MAATSWEYAGVHLSIDNYVIPIEKLTPTPSSNDNLEAEIEFDLRYLGCELIQDAGILLKLPQVAMATAQVLYQRYFYSKSFVRYVYEHYAMACIFLAAKIEESPRRIREVINVFHHIKQAREGRKYTPVMFDQAYANLKNHIIKAERRVLKELGFCVHGKHPHKLIIMYVKSLSLVDNKPLIQTAWNCMNDVLRTDVFVRHSPETVACACIFLAARRLGIPLPRHPPWWEMFNVDEESVHEIALCLQRLYARQKPDISALESRLAELRKKQAEEKEAALAAAAAAKEANKQAAELSSGNPSPATSVDQSHVDGDGTKGPSPNEVPQAKAVESKEDEPKKENTRLPAADNGARHADSRDSKSSYRPSDKRRPHAYNEADSKSHKARRNRDRSRSPLPRHQHSKSRRRRHSSSSSSYTTGSDDSRSPPRGSRKENGSRYKRRDHRDSHRRRSRSPVGDGKSRHRRRSRSASSYSSGSSRSDRTPPSKVPSRNRSPPPRHSSRSDYEKKPSKSTSSSSSKYTNGHSSSSSIKRIPVISSSKNRPR